jgi:hypothetical protein
VRVALADVLHGIAALLRSRKDAATNRQHTVEALGRADNFEALSRFETGMLPRQAHLPDLHGIERLAGAAFVATSDPLARAVDAQAAASLGDWLDRAAHATAEGSALPSVAETAMTAATGTPAQLAVSRLSMETRHVATSAQ